MPAATAERAWKFFQEFLDNDLGASLGDASLRAYYLTGGGGELVYQVLIRPTDAFGLAEMKLVTDLAQKHRANLTVSSDGRLVIEFPPAE